MTEFDTATPEAMRRALADVIALRDELAAETGSVGVVARAIAAEIDRALKGQRRAADQ